MMLTSKLLGRQGSKSTFFCETKLEQPLPCALDHFPAGSLLDITVLAYNYTNHLWPSQPLEMEVCFVQIRLEQG